MTDPGVFRVGAERIFRKNAGISLHLRTGVPGARPFRGDRVVCRFGGKRAPGRPRDAPEGATFPAEGEKKRRGSCDPRRVVRQKKSWQRPTFPPFGSIIGEGVLDFRVRNGNGYFHLSMATSI